ncbi:hypothetical protein KC19_11G098000 [Ceratodon purpureus]|uniref:Uncharacterized protein n=1 Tax=Ceratodon purpureus TaxID=3225 RepID=A0A8T0GFU5_CERPU|nr:hypothetical protein KC19_11G098000 [Ceratodon purpureus]
MEWDCYCDCDKLASALELLMDHSSDDSVALGFSSICPLPASVGLPFIISKSTPS